MFKSETEPFTFGDYLNNLPADIVLEKFVKNTDNTRKIISGAMIKDITSEFSTEKRLTAAFNNLSADAQLTCAYVYLSGAAPAARQCAAQPNMRANPVKSVGSVKPGRPHRVALPAENLATFIDDELLCSFLAYLGKDGLQETYYVRFNEFESMLRNRLCQTILEKARVEPEKEAIASLPYQCLNDVGALAGLTAQGNFEITRSGAMSKTSNIRVRKLLHAAQNRFDTGRNDFSPLALVIRFARAKGIILGEAPGVSHDRMLSWIAQPEEARHAELVDFAFASMPLWDRAMLDELFVKPRSSWISAEALGLGRKDDVVAQVKVLAYCGLVDWYRSGNNVVFTRASRDEQAPLKRPAQRIIIQPDFSTLLPQETTAEQLYWFSRVGIVESLDSVYRALIVKEIVCNSLCGGIAGADLLSKLSDWSAPGNVMETVKEWIREFERVSLLSGSLVVSSEEKVTRQLSSYAALMSCVEPIRADCVFKVHAGKEAVVQQMLVAMGYDPRPACRDAAAPAAATMPYPREEHGGPPVLTAVVDFRQRQPAVSIALKQGKYSAELKALDLTEVMHVIDYALLMGSRVRIDYSGSPGLRKGIYVILPLTYKKGEAPLLEAETGKSGEVKLFILARIGKIGVEPDHDDNQ